VLLHGGTGSWMHWIRNVEALSRDMMVVVPDLPGSGESASPQPPFSAGSPQTAPAHIVESLRARMRARMERDEAAALSRSGSA